MVGTVFAGHRIEARLGRGGMGVVYRARHCRLDRVVALKVIAPELLEDPSVQRRFREEAVVAASVEHPNVVPVHDAGEADGMPYLVMRYVRGTDLGVLARAPEPLPPRRAAEIVAEVAGALDVLHGAGYVHRDVKPRNVLVACDGHVFLSDFGLARRIAGDSSATRTGHWVGTLDFVAPEQIRGARTDARADVYGLGCLLFFALTGRPPYVRDDLAAKLWAHLHAPAPPASPLRPGIPPALDRVLARALAKDPGERFRSAGDLGRAALVASAGAPARPRVASPHEVDPRAAARPDASTVSGARPALAAAIGGAVAVC